MHFGLNFSICYSEFSFFEDKLFISCLVLLSFLISFPVAKLFQMDVLVSSIVFIFIVFYLSFYNHRVCIMVCSRNLKESSELIQADWLLEPMHRGGRVLKKYCYFRWAGMTRTSRWIWMTSRWTWTFRWTKLFQLDMLVSSIFCLFIVFYLSLYSHRVRITVFSKNLKESVELI